MKLSGTSRGENSSSFYSARDTGEMAISPRGCSRICIPEIRCSVQYGMGSSHFLFLLKTEPAGEYVIRVCCNAPVMLMVLWTF